MLLVILCLFLFLANCQRPIQFHYPAVFVFQDDLCTSPVLTSVYENYYMNCLADGGTSYWFDQNATAFTEIFYDSCTDCQCGVTHTIYRPAVPACTPTGTPGFWYQAPGDFVSFITTSSDHKLTECTPGVTFCSDSPMGLNWCRDTTMFPDTCVPYADSGEFWMMSMNASNGDLIFRVADADASCLVDPTEYHYPDGVCEIDPYWGMKSEAFVAGGGTVDILFFSLAPFAKWSPTEAECLETATVGDYFTAGVMDECVHAGEVWIRESCAADTLTIIPYEDALCTTQADDPIEVPLGGGACTYIPSVELWVRLSCDAPPDFVPGEYAHLSGVMECTDDTLFDVFIKKDECVGLPWSPFVTLTGDLVTAQAVCDADALSLSIYMDVPTCAAGGTTETPAEGACLANTDMILFRSDDGCDWTPNSGVGIVVLSWIVLLAVLMFVL